MTFSIINFITAILLAMVLSVAITVYLGSDYMILNFLTGIIAPSITKALGFPMFIKTEEK